MISLIKKYPLAFLMLVSFVMIFSNLGLIQTNIMEARNLVSAREMVNDGHWVFTTLNGLPRYEKPPLPTWLTAFSMLLFGMNNMFLLRLPVALVSLLLVYFFYKLMQSFQLKNYQPLHASLILITSFYIFFAGRDNQWDMYTHSFMIVCIYFLFQSFNQTKNVARNILLSGLFFGCSFLSKGPVSFYGLMLSFLIAYFIIYKNNIGRNLKLLLFVLIIGLAIGLSWPMYVKFFDTHAGTALSGQAKNWGSYEVKPFWYYWSFFTQSGLWTLPSFIALIYFYMRKKVTDVKAYTFSFLWTIISLILLSFIPEKKARYTLPILIPLAMNTSFYVEYLISEFKNIKSKFEIGLVYFSFGLIGFIGIALPFVAFFLFKTKLNGYIFWFVLLCSVSIFCGFKIFKSLYKKRFIKAFYACIFFMCGIVLTAIPLSKMFYSNNKYYGADNLPSIEKKLNIKTYEVNGFEPEIIWSYGKAITEISTDSSYTLPKENTFGIMISPDQSASFIQKNNNYSFTKYAVVDLNALSKNEKGYNQRLVKEYYVVKKLN